ncbi:MAG: VOC family protein [Luteolibacter sp.]
MKIEHIAINMADPVAFASWYSEHFNLRVARHIPEPNQTHFLTDSEGSMIEIYQQPACLPDYASMDPLQLHIAFVSADPDADRERLVAAGATFVSEQKNPDGTHLMMLRDPWGLALQLCKRVLDR